MSIYLSISRFKVVIFVKLERSFRSGPIGTASKAIESALTVAPSILTACPTATWNSSLTTRSRTAVVRCSLAALLLIVILRATARSTAAGTVLIFLTRISLEIGRFSRLRCTCTYSRYATDRCRIRRPDTHTTQQIWCSNRTDN